MCAQGTIRRKICPSVGGHEGTVYRGGLTVSNLAKSGSAAGGANVSGEQVHAARATMQTDPVGGTAESTAVQQRQRALDPQECLFGKAFWSNSAG